MKYFFSLFLTLMFLSSYSQELVPTPTHALISATVTNYADVPHVKETIIFEDQISKSTYEGVSDTKGKFAVLLPKGKKYKIIYKNYTNKVDYNEIDVPSGIDLLSYTITIKIDPPKKYTLKNVFFDLGKASLKATSNQALNDLYEVLKNKETMKIEISGHTDNVGSNESNQILSENRAKAVKNYLVRKGIASNRIQTKGYGDTRPVADNSTLTGRQENRRTEVLVLSE